MKTVYIAGPITGVENYNRQAFDDAERELVGLGFYAINPQIIGDRVFAMIAEPTWFDFMRACVPFLAKCDYIYLLPGWKQSRGAKWERIIAKHVFGLPVYENIADMPKNN